MQSLQKPEDKKENVLRPLDRAESNFWLYDRVSSMNFAVMAELKGSVAFGKLRKAIDTIQSFHTNAQVSITKKEDNSTYLAFVYSPDYKIPLEIYNELDWKNHLANEAIRLFSLDEAPLIRCLFYELGPDNSAIAFIFNHSIADGRSGCYFLLDVLKEYGSEKEHSASVKYRFASMMQLAPLFPENSVASPNPGKPDLLPNFTRKKENPNPLLKSFSIRDDHLQGLLRNAKSNGTSLHGAIGAAQSTAFLKLYSEPSPKSVLLATPADLRPYLTESVPLESLGLYITLFTTRLDLSLGFWDIAKTVTGDLRKKIENAEGRLFYESLPPIEQFLKREEAIKVFGSLMSRNPQTSVLSNVGILPEHDASNGIHVKNVSFTVHPSVTQTLFTTVTTFRGEAIVNVNYDSNRWKEDDIEFYVKEFQEVLERKS